MMTESIGEFGAEPLFQFASEIGQAPVPFQIKTVEGGSVGSFDVVVLVFGSSPPITGMSGLELDGLSGIATPVQLGEVEQRLAAVVLKKLLLEQITGIVAAARD